MRNAKQFRDMSRHVLIKRYWWAVLAGLIALLLGASASVPGLHITFDLDDWFRSLSTFCYSLTSLRQIIRQLFALSFSSLFSSLWAVALLFVGAAIELGYNRYQLRQYETADAPDLKLLFSRFSIFWRAVGLRMLTLLKVFLWSLLFIVPGIVAAFRYALAPYLLAEDPNITPQEAMERSRDLMLGHKARLFRLYLSFFGWYLLACLSFGIGFVFLEPYIKTAGTGFYLERIGRLPLPGEQPAYHGQPEPATVNDDSSTSEAPQQATASHTTPEWI